MTTLLVFVAGLVALAAAVRSTWSPCGLSMLSTITPLSERAKGHSYRATASWFVAGATAGGLTLGGVAALCAAGVRALGPSPLGLGVLAAGAASVAALSDLAVFGLSLPIHRRQVNERWLDHFRPWVYGAGFGWQIGVGLATYITTRRGLLDGGLRRADHESGRGARRRRLLRSRARARGVPHPLDHREPGAPRVPPTPCGRGASTRGPWSSGSRSERRRWSRQPSGHLQG